MIHTHYSLRWEKIKWLKDLSLPASFGLSWSSQSVQNAHNCTMIIVIRGSRPIEDSRGISEELVLPFLESSQLSSNPQTRKTWKRVCDHLIQCHITNTLFYFLDLLLYPFLTAHYPGQLDFLVQLWQTTNNSVSESKMDSTLYWTPLHGSSLHVCRPAVPWMVQRGSLWLLYITWGSTNSNHYP